MAEGIAFACLGKIGEELVNPIRRQFGYLFCFNNNLQNFDTELEILRKTRQGVEQGVAEASRNLRTIGPHVEGWLTRVNNITAEAETIIAQKAEVQKGCLNGWCPNLKLRYSLNRKAVKKTHVLVCLQAEGNQYAASSYGPLPPSMKSN